MQRKNGRIARRISFLCCSSKRRMHIHTCKAPPEGLLTAHLLKTAFPVLSLHEQAAYSHVCSSVCTHRCSVWFFFVRTYFSCAWISHSFRMLNDYALVYNSLFYSTRFSSFIYFFRSLFICLYTNSTIFSRFLVLSFARVFTLVHCFY